MDNEICCCIVQNGKAAIFASSFSLFLDVEEGGGSKEQEEAFALFAALL